MTSEPSQAESEDATDWTPFPAAAYAALLEGMAHFSTKSANSNAEAGGIRITAEHALKLPYLSVRTLLAAGRQVELDYLKNSGKTATLTKQLRQALKGGGPPEEATAIRAAYTAALQQPLEVGTSMVSPRLRQLLLPRKDAPGGYVAVTPLSAAGTASLILQFVRAHNGAMKSGELSRDEHRRIRTCTLGFGGSNPQNVGSLIRDLQTTVVADAPQERPGVRAALALFHRGPELRLPPALMEAYAQWRAHAMAGNDGDMPTGLAARLQEKAFIQDIATSALRGVREQYRLLQQHRRYLPLEPAEEGEASLFAASVDPWIKGIAEPVWRRADWARVTAGKLAALIVDHRLRGAAVLGLDDDARSRLAGWIEEAL